MADHDRPLLEDVKNTVGRLAVDLREMADLRWQLARLELAAAASSVKRLIVVLVVAAVMALSVLPILAVCAAELLDGWMGISKAGWLLTLGLGLLGTATLLGGLARLRFRRRFVGLEQTVEELREDLVWMAEWTGRATAESDGSDAAAEAPDGDATGPK